MSGYGSAVVLLSGGLDSGVALAEVAARGVDVTSLFADYGQRAVAAERRAAERLAARFGADFVAVDLPWLADCARAAGSALVDRSSSLPQRTSAAPGDEASAAAVWVPARNVVLLACAAAIAEARGKGAVVAGFNREEAATFADNSPDFVAAATALLGLGTRTGVVVDSPTLGLDKRAIVAAARRHGLGAADFFSCYAAGPDPCGTCESCVRAQRAWANGPVDA